MSSSAQFVLVEQRAQHLVNESDQVCCGGCLEFIPTEQVAEVRVVVPPSTGLTSDLMIGYAVCAACAQKKPSAVERRVRRMCKLPEEVQHMRTAMLHRYAIGLLFDLPAEIMPRYV